MMILIPPAKTFKQSQTIPSSSPLYTEDTLKLVTKLKRLSIKKLRESMHISDKLASEVHAYYQSFGQHTQPAIESYDGYLYRHLSFETISNKHLPFADEHLRIISGLYGLLRPMDGISFYRLEMKDNSVTNLYTFWKKTMIKAIHEHELVIDLTSDEYRKAIPNMKHVIHLDFYLDAKKRAPSMEAKRLRGLCARKLIEHEITSVDSLQTLVIDDYHFDTSLSTKNHYIYTKQ